jgi:mono/diheme cytochrome c family protein
VTRRAVSLAAVLLALGCRSDPATPNIEYIPEMVDSVAYDSFALNPVTPDGKTLIAPVPGTIARGRMPLHYGPGPEEARRAGRDLLNPLPASDESRARGEKVFQSFCALCHGVGGLGDGPLVPRFPAPPSLVADRARKMPDGQMFHVLTHGQGLMAGYAAQVGRKDRWRVIHYVRSLKVPAPPPPGGPK